MVDSRYESNYDGCTNPDCGLDFLFSIGVAAMAFVMGVIFSTYLMGGLPSKVELRIHGSDMTYWLTEEEMVNLQEYKVKLIEERSND